MKCRRSVFFAMGDSVAHVRSRDKRDAAAAVGRVNSHRRAN
jgi:hypothetical protein